MIWLLVFGAALSVGALSSMGDDDDSLAGKSDDFGDEDDGIIVDPNVDQVIQGTAGADQLLLGDGNDIFVDIGGNDIVAGGAGNDSIAAGPGKDIIDGNGGDDIIAGGDDADLLTGGAGSDIIEGDEGADQIFGGNGLDVILGGTGDDVLHGGEGTDYLQGDEGDDLLLGEGGDDALHGMEGNDTLRGGNGDDLLNGASFTPTSISNSLDAWEAFNSGTDMRDSIVSTDLYYRFATNDADDLGGGAGNDTLIGDGNDTLTGGAGEDLFLTGNWIEGSIMRITDFTPGEDRLLFRLDPGEDTSFTAETSVNSDGSADVVLFWRGEAFAVLENNDDPVAILAALTTQTPAGIANP